MGRYDFTRLNKFLWDVSKHMTNRSRPYSLLLQHPQLRQQRVGFGISDLAFLLMIITLPLQGQGIDIGISISISFVFGILFVILNLRYLHLPQLDPIELSLYGFTLFLGISLLYTIISGRSSDLGMSLRGSALRGLIHWFRFIFLFLYYDVLIAYFNDNFEQRFGALIHGITIPSWFAVFFGSYQLIGSSRGWPFVNINNLHYAGQLAFCVLSGKQLFRVFATFGEPRGYGLFLVMVIPLLLCSIVLERNGPDRHKASSRSKWILVTLLLWHLFATVSIAAYLLSIMGILVYLTLSRIRFRLLLRLLLVLTVIGVVIRAWFQISIVDFVTELNPFLTTPTTFQVVTESSGTLARLLYNIRVAWDIMLENPVFGLGPGGMAGYVQQHGLVFVRSDLQGATNFVSYLLANTGAIGTLFFLLVVVMHIRQGWLALKDWQFVGQNAEILKLVFIGMLMAIGGLMIVGTQGDFYVWIMFALTASLARHLSGHKAVVSNETTCVKCAPEFGQHPN